MPGLHPPLQAVTVMRTDTNTAYPHTALQWDKTSPRLVTMAQGEHTGFCVTLIYLPRLHQRKDERTSLLPALTIKAVADVFMSHVGERAVARVKEQHLSRSRQFN